MEFDLDDDFSRHDLEFVYLDFNKYLFELYKQGIDNINILLLVSLERDYYEGENLKKILLDLKKLSNELVCNFNGKKVKFKINQVEFDVGDVLNRHMWIYRYIENYLIENNMDYDCAVPQNIMIEFRDRAYSTGKQQGKDWFKNHAIESINKVLFDDEEKNDISLRIQEDFQLTDGVTQIYKGGKNFPKIQYNCYEYWLKHPKYKFIEKVLQEVRCLPNSILERAYNHEAEFFVDNLNKRGIPPKFPDLFKKYSKDYLIDESIEHTIIQQDVCNNFEFYYRSMEPVHTKIFRTKKVKNNNVIQGYLQKDLFGIDRGNFITFKNKI